VRFCGIGILPMRHGLEAHATKSRPFAHPLRWYALFCSLGLLTAAPGFCSQGLRAQRLGAQGFGNQPVVRPLLPETTFFDRVDGRILHLDVNDTWLFEPAQDVKTPELPVPAGARFVLLPSSTLAQLIADVNDRAAPRYRLSARVTRYAGQNFLLPIHFLPLSRFKDEPEPDDQAAPAADRDPNLKPPVTTPRSDDPELAIPPEVLEQLKKQRPLRGTRKGPAARKAPAPGPDDRVLVDSVGLIEIVRQPAPAAAAPVRQTWDPNEPPVVDRGPPIPGTDPTGMVFLPYALGRNLSRERYVLLPCATLEQAVERQARMPDRIRFNVAGLVTEFQGRKYLLLQRAAFVYNYGNFAR